MIFAFGLDIYKMSFYESLTSTLIFFTTLIIILHTIVQFITGKLLVVLGCIFNGLNS